MAEEKAELPSAAGARGAGRAFPQRPGPGPTAQPRPSRPTEELPLPGNDDISIQNKIY